MLKFLIAVNLLLLTSIFVCGQTSPTLTEIIDEAEKQTLNYQETFRNLLAIETKTSFNYDKNEKVKKQSKIEANFLVYQSSKNNKISFELRNVINVDGKLIPNSQANSDNFFAELSKTSTLKSELEKIQKVSSKYDKTFDISGVTLYEGIVLSNSLRAFFDFQLIGKENFQEQEVYVISYRQIKQSPYILINKKGNDFNNPSLEFEVDIPSELKKNETYLNGKFWIDAKTFQIWREERELIVQTNEPLKVLKTDFEYQNSDYGILVPKQINFTVNNLKKKDGKYITVKNSSIIFDYSKFRKTETDVKILDDTEN